MSKPRVNIIERIERHLGEMRDGECWITDYATSGDGYPKTRIGRDGKELRLSRVAWEAHNAEPIPDGMVVCHKCDNPACINPEHLFIATQADNIRDCRAKGRSRCISSKRARERAYERPRDANGRWI